MILFSKTTTWFPDMALWLLFKAQFDESMLPKELMTHDDQQKSPLELRKPGLNLVLTLLTVIMHSLLRAPQSERRIITDVN